MPIIAQSPPLIFGATPTPTPPPSRVVTPAPPAAGTPVREGFPKRHKEFLAVVDSKPTCFKKEEITGFTGEELDQHLQVAMLDKYITQSGDMYCTMQAVSNLKKALKRLGED